VRTSRQISGHARSIFIRNRSRELPASALASVLIESGANPFFRAPDDVTRLPDMISFDDQNKCVRDADGACDP
jgi:hypothetical protein